MRTRPTLSARSQKAQYVVAAFVPALIVVLSVTGFVWAQKPVTVVVDGRPTAAKTQARDVAAVLDEQGVGIGAADIVIPSPSTRITSDMTIVVKHAIPVTIRIAGEDTKVAVIGKTVADALVAVGADPLQNMAVTPALTTPLTPGMTIVGPDDFIRVEKQRKPIKPAVIVRRDPTRAFGDRAVVSSGKPGVELCVWKVGVADGKACSRVLTSRTRVQEPRPRVIAVGCAKSIEDLVAVANRETKANTPPVGGRKMVFGVTAYSAQESSWGHATASGTYARRGVIAVDPSVIPLGTKVYIPGYGYAIAGDTGQRINGNRIDVYVESMAEMEPWGFRTLTCIVFDK